MACLRSVKSNTPDDHPVLLLDDCSTDPGIPRMLAEFCEQRPNSMAIRNRENLGYTKNINQALKATDRDILILNSDTRVTPDWLKKIQRCAASHPNTATVTPLSNAAGAFSIPENNQTNPLPDGISEVEMAKILEECSERQYVQVPTGNGYCMFIKYDSLLKVGLFDEEAFPRGYGEENDFCMRAVKAGFVNLIDDATFIYHERSASFGEEKQQLLSNNRKRLNALHPEYSQKIKNWLENDPLNPLRRRIRSELAHIRGDKINHG